MADLRIVDAPLLSTVKGTEKLPTGGEGNFSVSVNQVADFAKLKWFLATEGYVDNAVGNVQADLNLHKNNSSNPHGVTKEQVGLSNVDNTADLDKPLSNAVTATLLLKADKNTTYTKLEVDESLNVKSDKAETFTKTEVNSLLIPKADISYVNESLSALSTSANKFYPTLAEGNADIANLTVNQPVNIGEETNGGLWYKATIDATSLTKSPHDPLTVSKEYSRSLITLQNTKQLYNTENNKLHININPTDGSIRTVTSAQVNVFPIVAGETYTLNTVGFNTTYVILAVSPDNTTTVGKAQTLQPLTAGVDADTKTFVAPITGFAFINVVWTPSLDISTTLSIKSSEFVEAVRLMNEPIRDQLAQQRLDNADIENVLNKNDLTIVNPNLYDSATKTPLFFVGTTGTIVSNTGGELVCFPIIPNKTYLIKSPQFLSTKTVGLSDTNTVINGKAITNRTLSATTDPNVYSFTTTIDDAAFFYAFFTTRLDTQSYDVRNSVEIYEGSVPVDNSPYIESIKGVRLLASVEPKPVTISTRLTDKKVWTEGDSITEGTNGAYQPEMDALFGTTIENHGSSGGRASRVVDIITAGEGMPKRDAATSDIVWTTKNFTDLACVTLMIGTNDSDAAIGTMGDISQLPLGNITEYPVTNDYWALFPNNYLCNIALFIEFIRWKAPEAEIHICTPPYRNQDGVSDETRITKLIPLLEDVCQLYAVHLIYGTYENGMGYKAMRQGGSYSPDGVHFNLLGNKIFGKFFAQKVLSFG